MSDDVPTSIPVACAGESHPGVPVTTSLGPSRATGKLIPRSTTRTPSGPYMAFDGFRSRWMIPALWISASASPIPDNTVMSSVP